MGLIALALLASAGCGNKRAPEAPSPASLQRLSGPARGWYLQAMVAEQQGDLSHARYAVAWMVRLDRFSPWAQLAAGRFWSRQGEREKALGAFQEAVGLAPEHAEAHLELGRAWLAFGDKKSAVPSLEKAARGGISEAYALLGELYLGQNTDEGRVAARENHRAWTRLEVNPDQAAARAAMGLKVKAPETAVDDALKALDAQPTSTTRQDLFVQTGLAACRVGTVWSWLKRAEHTDTWADNAARVAEEAGDDAMLEEALQQAGNVLGLVRFYLARERHAEALQALGARIGADADMLRGRAHAGLGQVDEAVAAWTAEEPVPPRALERAVELLIEAERVEEARGLVAAKVSTDLATAWARVLVLQAEGEVTEAETLLARTGGWSDAERSRRLARLRLMRGDTSGADAALLEGAERGDPLAWRQVAQLRERSGGDSAAAWHGLTRVDDDDPDAWVGIARADPARREDALARALGADRCHLDALLLYADTVSDCARRRSIYERAWEVRPLDARVRDGLAQRCE